MIDISTILDSYISQALFLRTSDIHIQPYPHYSRIRFRIDGALYDQCTLKPDEAIQLIARIKVLSRLDVAEKRRPQDGAFSFTSDNASCDLRVATFPSLHGEKVVLRLLDRSGLQLELSELGLSKAHYDHLSALVAKEGCILVTGPTGSGKTTMLHALLALLPSHEKNIVTLEDPIEYILPGVTQSSIQPDLGITFEAGLRALLRQDPDVIMVGEIRDSETASVALQAALTGHQVMSTLHTSDAPGALMRLAYMGCERFMIAAALKAIVAQRLVRKLCNDCKKETEPLLEQYLLLQSLGRELAKISTASGCEKCMGTGYKGRIGVFQLMFMSTSILTQFIEGADYEQLKKVAYAEGMNSLADDAFEKLEQGVIGYSEWVSITLC